MKKDRERSSVGRFGQIAISAPNPVTTDVDLANCAVGDRATTFIEQINGRASYRPADGWSSACPRLEHRRRSDDGTFGGAVVIDYVEAVAGRGLMQHVAPGEHKTQRGSNRPVHSHHGCGVDCGNEADRHAFAYHPLL